MLHVLTVVVTAGAVVGVRIGDVVLAYNMSTTVHVACACQGRAAAVGAVGATMEQGG